MKRFVWLFLLLWVLPALACNIPRRGQMDPFPTPEVESWEGLIFPTPLPGEEPPLPEVEAPAEPPTPPEEPAPPPPTPQIVQGMVLPPPALDGSGAYFFYPAQAGDTLPTLARRFEVESAQITSDAALPAGALLLPGQNLVIPNQVGSVRYPWALLPDSEIIYSPSTVGFNIDSYILEAGGYLSGYSENVSGERMTGAEIVRLVALENSINPRLLLAFLEHRSGWVFGEPLSPARVRYPIGFYVENYTGLHKELSLTAKMLTMGYYGWRSGELTRLEFQDGRSTRMAPGLNAGSASLQFLFGKFYREADWTAWLYDPGSFIALHFEMFGDPWQRAAAVEPILPGALMQPNLELPFRSGERWVLTGGPHPSWLTGTPRGALDFAPVTGERGCVVSSAWTTSAAAGLVVRSERNVVVIDLDGDGYEQTGWTLFYFHVADRDRVPAGTWVELDDPIGHPSCEGGNSTGTHVHIARKYNGEWIAADGPLPFVLSGWRAVAASRAYDGFLVRDERTISASPGGSSTSAIIRD
jgi:LasA protease